MPRIVVTSKTNPQDPNDLYMVDTQSGQLFTESQYEQVRRAQEQQSMEADGGITALRQREYEMGVKKQEGLAKARAEIAANPLGIDSVNDRNSILARSLDRLYNALSSSNPDENATLLETAENMGINAVSALNFNDKPRQELIEFAKSAKTRPNWGKLADNNPDLALMLNSPMKLAKSYDDIDNLVDIDNIMNFAKASYQYGQYTHELGMIGARAMEKNQDLNSMDEEDKKRMTAIRARMADLQKYIPSETLSAGGIASGIIQGVPQLLAMAQGASLAGGVAGALGMTGPVGWTIAGIGATFVGAHDYARQQQGLTYLNTLDAGAKKENAKQGALSSYIGNMAIGSLAGLIGGSPAMGAFTRMFTQNVARQNALAALTASVSVGVSMATTDVLATKIALGRANQWSATDLAQIGEAGIANALPTGAMMVAPYGLHMMAGLGRAVDKSKFYARDPDGMAEYINQKFEGTNASTVEVDAVGLVRTLNNLSNEDAQRAAEHLGVDYSMIEGEAAGGGDVQVGIGEFVTLPQEIREQLLQYAKVTGEMSPMEAGFDLQMFASRADRVDAGKYLKGTMTDEQRKYFEQKAQESGFDSPDDYATAVLYSGEDAIEYIDALEGDPLYEKLGDLGDRTLPVDEQIEKLIQKDLFIERDRINRELDNMELYKAETELELDLETLGRDTMWKAASDFRKGALSEEGMAAFERIAERHGFDSGDHLAQSVMNTRNRLDEFNARMAEAEDRIRREWGVTESQRRVAGQFNDANSLKIMMEQESIVKKGLGEPVAGERLRETIDAISERLKENPLKGVRVTKNMPETLKTAIKDTRQLNKDMKKMLTSAKKDASKVTKHITELETTVKKLTDQIEKESKTSAEALKDNAKGLEKANATIKQLERALDEANKTIDELKKAANEGGTEAYRMFAAEGFDKVNADNAAAAAGWSGSLRVQDVRQIARESLMDMPIWRARRWDTFHTTAERARARSNYFFKKGDFANALDWKNREWIAFEQAAQAYRLDREILISERALRGIAGAGKKGFKTEEAYLQAGALMKQYGLAMKDYEATVNNLRKNNVPPPISLRQWVAKMYEQTAGVEIADWLFDEKLTMRYTDLSFDRFKDLRNAISNIKKTDQNLDKLRDRRFKMGVTALGKTLATEINEYSHPTRNLSDVATNTRTVGEHVKDIMQEMETPETAVINMAGRYSRMYEFFVKRADECADNYSRMVKEYAKEYVENIKSHYTSKQWKDVANRKIYIEEMGISLTKLQMLTIAKNFGNEGNYLKLMNTRPTVFRDAKIYNPSAVERMLRDNLNKNDWEYIQGEWNIIGKLWPDVARFERRMKGFTPEGVPPRAFSVVTSDGETLNLSGGYYPLARSRMQASQKGNLSETSSPLYFNTTSYTTAMTRHGFTKMRTSGEYEVNINDPFIGLKHIKDVVRDLTYREYIEDYNRIMNNQDFVDAVRRWGGENAMDLFDKHRKIMAGNTFAPAMAQEIANMTNAIRRGYTTAILGVNVANLLQNAANILMYPRVVDWYGWKDVAHAIKTKAPRFWINALTSWRTEYSIRQEVFAKSAYMADLNDAPDMSLLQLQDALEPGKYKKGPINRLRAIGQYLMAATDQMWSIPVWQDAYEKRLKMGYSDKDAVQGADSVVRGVVGSGRRQDQSRVVNTPSTEMLSIFTQFYTFFNVGLNRWMREIGAVRREGWSAVPNMALYMAVRCIPFYILSNLLAWRWPDEDEDPLAWFVAGAINQELGGVILAREMGPIINTAMGIEAYSFRGGGTVAALAATIPKGQKIVGTIRDIATGEPLKPHQMEQTLEAITTILATYTGFPLQINNWVWNAYDWAMNGMDPEFRDLFRRRPQKERYPKTKKQLKEAARRKILAARRKKVDRLRRERT